MLLTKIREHLSVVLAMVAALAVCSTIILGLRNQTLHANINTLSVTNQNLASVNEQSAKAIDKLISQRTIDNRILEILDSKYRELAKESDFVRTSMKELLDNDVEFKTLLNKRHPDYITELLNQRVNNPNKNGDTNTAE